MPDSAAVQEWIRFHRLLMDKETAFTDLAIRAAAGEITLEELDEHREELLSMRVLCTAVYNKAFPKPAQP